MPALHLEFLAAALVIRNEEFFDLIEQGLAYIVQRLDVLMIVGMNGDRYQSVVLDDLSFFYLLRFDYADNADVQQTTDMGRLVHEHHHVEWIAVLGQRGRNEAEVERKCHPFGQQAAQTEEPEIGIIIEFVSPSFRSLDDSLGAAQLGVPLVRTGFKVRHA